MDRQETMIKEKKKANHLNYLRNNKKGCGLLVAIKNSKEIKCGDKMMGKKRYCLNCTASAENTSQEEYEPKNNKGKKGWGVPYGY